MKREDHRPDRRIMAFAAFALLLLSVTLPLLLVEDPAETLLKTASVRAAEQNSFSLTHPLQISSEPRIIVSSGTVSLAQPKGAAPLTSRAVARLLESGTSVLILRHATIVIGADEKHYLGATNDQGAPLARALAQMNYRALLVEHSIIEAASERGAPTVFRDAQFKVRRGAGERLSAAGSVTYLGRSVDFDATISARVIDRAAGQLPIRGTVVATGLFSASYAGQFALGDGGRLIADSSRLEISDVPTFARWLGLSWPTELGIDTFTSVGEFQLTRQIANFPKGNFVIDSNSATGSLHINGKGARPLIDGTLAFDRLDVGALVRSPPQHSTLFASTVQETAEWLPPRIRQVLSDMRLPILRELDIDLRVSAETAVFGQLNAERTAAAVSLRDGRVLIDLAEMGLPAGGHGSLQLTADTNQTVTKCGLRGNLKGVRFENVADLVFPHQVIVGPADVTLDLTGDWENPDTFIRSLDGRVGMRMANGASLGADLQGLVKSVKAYNVPKSGWGEAAKGRTGLESVTADLVFENGIARIDQLLARRHGRSELAVTGSFNIHGKSLNISVIPRSAEGFNDEGPSVLSINGRWDRPMLIRRSFRNRAYSPLAPPSSHDAEVPADVDDASARRG
jgi:AsmA family